MMAGLAEEWKAVATRWHPVAKEGKAAMLERFALGYCYNSGKIENDAVELHDTSEIFKNGRVVSFTGDVRTLFEIANLRRSWAWACEYAGSRSGLDETMVLKAHEMLCSGTYDDVRWEKGERPGQYKKGDYGVGPDAAIGAAIGASPEDAREEVLLLLSEIDAAGGGDANSFAAAAWLHAGLVDIHPFADGNGRTARLLMNFMLMSADLPPICIFEQDRMAYYGALDAFHCDGNFDPFLEFCRAEAIKTYETLLVPEGKEIGIPLNESRERRGHRC